MKYIKLFLLPLLFASVISCSSNFAEQDIDLSIPSWPPKDSKEESYPELDYWLLTVTCGTKTESSVISKETHTVSVNLNQNRNIPVSVIITPITNEFSFFCPAGAILPYNAALNWEDGFAAKILENYYNRTKELNSDEQIKNYAQRFNWNKLIKSIHEKALTSSIFYNPWNLDIEKIVSTIEEQNFSLTLLTQKNCKILQSSTLLGDYLKENSILLSNYVPYNNYILQDDNIIIYTKEINLFLEGEEIIYVDFANNEISSFSVCNLPIKKHENKALCPIINFDCYLSF